MKYAVIGGDERAAFLAVRLREAGHSVRCWALEKSSLAGKLPRTGCLEGCVYGADWVLLPVPAEREGRLHAPLSVQRPGMAELLGALWPGQVLCGGGFAPETSLAAVRAGRMLVAEECIETGSVGQRIRAMLSGSGVPVLALSCGDRFLPCGSIADLQKLCGLDAASIAESAAGFLEKLN